MFAPSALLAYSATLLAVRMKGCLATRIPAYASNINLLQRGELIEVISEASAAGLRDNEKKCKRRFTSTVKEVTHSTEAWRKSN